MKTQLTQKSSLAFPTTMIMYVSSVLVDLNHGFPVN